MGGRPEGPLPCTRSLLSPRVHRWLPCKRECSTPILALAGAGSLPLPRGTILIHGNAAVGTPGSLQACGHGRASFCFLEVPPQALCSERAGAGVSLGTAARRLGL